MVKPVKKNQMIEFVFDAVMVIVDQVKIYAIVLGIVKNNVHNVPPRMFSSYIWPQPGVLAPEQFFMTP